MNFTLALHKSTSRQIKTETLMPPEGIETETKVVKTDIAKMLKDGAQIPGASLVENQSLQIK